MADDPLLPRRVFAVAASFAVLENSVTRPIARAPPHSSAARAIGSSICVDPPHQLAAVPIEELRYTIPITGPAARFSPIRFLLTGAAPNMGT